MSLGKYLYVVIILILQSTVNASPKNTVNILTRYNYLRSPKISEIIKNRCGVEISYDEYYTRGECTKVILQSSGLDYYDIAIIPQGVHDVFDSSIKTQKSNIGKAAVGYSEPVRKQYFSRHYPNNVAYFTLYIQGFIWNPNTLNISKTESILSMFTKAKNNIVIIESSHPAVFNLIDGGYDLSPDLQVNLFRNIIQDADVFITSGYNKLYEKNHFAFAFQNSGDAISIIKKTENKKLKFFIHPKYSYVSTDILIALNSRRETHCVAQALVSKEILKIVQQETFCLSPYETYKSMDDQIFQETYKKIFDETFKKKWFNVFFDNNVEKHNKLHNLWHKIHSLPQIMKNHSLILEKDH